MNDGANPKLKLMNHERPTDAIIIMYQYSIDYLIKWFGICMSKKIDGYKVDVWEFVE